MEKVKVEHHSFMGGLWVLGWLFTIGFLHLGFPKAVFAILIWAYYLGVHFSHLGY
ncbi:MAG TPA: hypothetical protein VMD98_03510 [Bryocella sp.]|nr:hypothetical protein [Bryocella sp.]